MLSEIVAAGGQVCYHGCTATAASGARMQESPEQAILMLGCLLFAFVAFVSGVLDIVVWREKERERKAGRK